MCEHPSITRLAGDLRSEDTVRREEAARRLWECYSERLLNLAAQHLSTRVRQREDEQDIAQDAFKSFCLRQQKGEFRLGSRNELWHLLVTITLCKARNVVKRHRRGKRDYRKEDAVATDTHEGTDWSLEQIQASLPSPEETAMFKELFHKLVLGLPADLRRIALARLEGCTNQEIAVRLGCVEQTVLRKIKIIRNRWQDATSAEP